MQKRFASTVATFLLSSAVLAPSACLAAGADDLTRANAVAESGVTADAPPAQFLRSFTALGLRLKSRDLPAYVGSAVQLRPELAAEVVAAALRIVTDGRDAGSVRALTERIIKAAITANPVAAVNIVKAAMTDVPRLRDSILSAAVTAAPDQRVAIMQAGSDSEMYVRVFHGDERHHGPPDPHQHQHPDGDRDDDDDVNSPEKPPSAR